MRKSTRRQRSAPDRANHREEESRRRDAESPPSANGPLIRNLVIIAVLILVIAFTWKKYRRTLAVRETERQQTVENNSRPRLHAVPFEAPAKEPVAGPEPIGLAEAIPVVEPVPEPEPPAEPPAEPQPAPTDAPPSPPESASPAQSLIRLRDDLAAGKRDEMPVGTVRRGDSDFFLVTTPMTWLQANGFADAYGGHLPLANNGDDLAWLASQPGDDVSSDAGRPSLWIGARKLSDKWYGIDSTPLDSAPEGTGDFAAISAGGTLLARGDADRHRFFIQWQRDGSNPASLRAVLARTKDSLDSPAPSFPPGTIREGGRHLLIVPRAIGAHDARELAEVAGGHLLVPATPAEADWLVEQLTGTDYPKGLWLGGVQSEDEWRWDSGEAWTFARWDPASPPGAGTALMIVPGAGWQSADPAAEASGFVIEWGGDSAEPGEAGEAPGHDGMLEKACELLAALQEQRTKDLATNATTFTWSLDSWLRNNNNSEIARWKASVDALKLSVRANRVPGDLPERPNGEFSERMLKIARGCLDKQNAIDAEFLARTARIRDAYVARMLELAAAENERGQPALARKSAATAEAASDLKAWLARIATPPAE